MATARRRRTMLAEVREGLSRTPRELSPKYFYDERGSQLFEEITRLPEYYLTRAEREILVGASDEIVDAMAPRTLVELGAGSAAKTRILLDAMRRARVGRHVRAGRRQRGVPRADARALEREISVAARRAGRRRHRRVARSAADRSAARFCSRFSAARSATSTARRRSRLLRRVRAQMRPGDRLLLGTDLRKDRETLEAAYNDSRRRDRRVQSQHAARAERRARRRLRAGALRAHRAFYNDDDASHRDASAMRSASRRFTFPGMPTLALREGETHSHGAEPQVRSRGGRRARWRGATARSRSWFTDRRSAGSRCRCSSRRVSGVSRARFDGASRRDPGGELLAREPSTRGGSAPRSSFSRSTRRRDRPMPLLERIAG